MMSEGITLIRLVFPSRVNLNGMSPRVWRSSRIADAWSERQDIEVLAGFLILLFEVAENVLCCGFEVFEVGEDSV